MSGRLFTTLYVGVSLLGLGTLVSIALVEREPVIVPANAMPEEPPTIGVFLRRGPEEVEDIVIWEPRIAVRAGDRLQISVASPRHRHATIITRDAEGRAEVLVYERLDRPTAVMLPMRWTIPEPWALSPVVVALSERELQLPQIDAIASTGEAAGVWTRRLVFDHAPKLGVR